MLPQTLDGLSGWCSPQVWVPSLGRDHGSERVAQEGERLASRIPQTRLLLVQGQSDLAHRPPRPLQGFLGVAAAEDDKVIRVVDELGAELLALPSLAPCPQVPMHLDVGQQGTADASHAKDNQRWDRCGKMESNAG